MNEAIALYSTTENQSIPLISTSIDGQLHDLMSDITVEQIFKNTGPDAIEAVYTFPLPHRAVLMALQVKLGERVLEGTVQKANDASERYEEAISDGDGAILLEKISQDDNLYTMNVGNIRPQETVVIRFNYALLNLLNGNELRLAIPTTISPRYGNPYDAGMAPHQIPQTDISVEHRYSLHLKITGIFKDASMESPTHQIDKQQSHEVTEITFARGSAFLDRDFVLNIFPSEVVSSAATFGDDLEGHAVMATFIPRLPAFESNAHDIRVVIDCSQSMAGDSIAQARKALQTILDELRPNDFFNIILFGNHTSTLFKESVQANKQNIAKAKRHTKNLNANMGGTEMGTAIRAACEPDSKVASGADILLITDGEIYEHEQVVSLAGSSNHRVFSVGVGSGVAEAFIRNIAEATNGMHEFVTPNEDMSRHITRHFRRIYSVGASAELIWPGEIRNVAPVVLPPIYSGDTVHVFGHSHGAPEGEIELKLTINDTTIIQKTMINSSRPQGEIPSTLARLSANARLGDLSDNDQVDIAVRYQLMTDKTSYLVVDKREADEQTDGAPVLKVVDQMLTAGWGGSSSVTPSASASYVEKPAFLRRSVSELDNTQAMDLGMDFEIDDSSVPPYFGEGPWADFCSSITSILNSGEYKSLRLNDLEELGVVKWIVQMLQSLRDMGYSDEEIVIAFLMKLVNLRLKDEVDESVIKDLKLNQPESMPTGIPGVLTALVNALEKEMDMQNTII